MTRRTPSRRSRVNQCVATVVAVVTAILPTGNVLFWASNLTNNFTANGNTQTVIFDTSSNSWFAHSP